MSADDTTNALLAMTREIGGLTEAVKGQGREIYELKTAIEKKTNSCTICRKEIDIEIDQVRATIQPIKELHTSEKAVSVFLSSIPGQISMCLAILSTSAAIIATFVWPLLAGRVP